MAKVPKEILVTLLQTRDLVVQNEDSILEILALWYRYHPDAEMDGMLDKIRWGFVSLAGLMTVVDRYPELKSEESFQEAFTRELAYKFENKIHQDTPRECYAPITADSISEDLMDELSYQLLGLDMGLTSDIKKAQAKLAKKQSILNELQRSHNNSTHLKINFEILRDSFIDDWTVCDENASVRLSDPNLSLFERDHSPFLDK